MLLGKVVICLQKTELYPCLSPGIGINSKWIKNLKSKPENLQLIQERAGNTLEPIHISKDFFSRSQVTQQLTEKMDKWDYMKLKTSAYKRNGLSIKETTHRVGENIC
jgi:hypothetical protein